jgi:hypothetical protein
MKNFVEEARAKKLLWVCLVRDQNMPRLTLGKLGLPEKIWRGKLKPHLCQSLARK